MAYAKLTLQLPDGSSTPYDLTAPSVTLGRGLSNTVIVPHESVAECHLDLMLDTSGYLIRDLVGGGATLLNGHALEKGMQYQLDSGSTIRLGEVDALYEAEALSIVMRHAVAVDFPKPGSFARPKHPAGLFVPLKKKRQPLAVMAITLAILACLAAVLVVLRDSNLALLG
ncbi:MAG: Inner rane component of cytoplasmic domain [Verrucomicrobiota bacterium]|jgi:hypothetical protein